MSKLTLPSRMQLTKLDYESFFCKTFRQPHCYPGHPATERTDSPHTFEKKNYKKDKDDLEVSFQPQCAETATPRENMKSQGDLKVGT